MMEVDGRTCTTEPRNAYSCNKNASALTRTGRAGKHRCVEVNCAQHVILQRAHGDHATVRASAARAWTLSGKLLNIHTEFYGRARRSQTRPGTGSGGGTRVERTDMHFVLLRPLAADGLV
jgi:hypothetical protein